MAYVDVQPSLAKSSPHGLGHDFGEVLGLEIGGIGGLATCEKTDRNTDVVVREFQWATRLFTNMVEVAILTVVLEDVANRCMVDVETSGDVAVGQTLHLEGDDPCLLGG